MHVDELKITESQLYADWRDWRYPLGIVELDRFEVCNEKFCPPPFPLIGISSTGGLQFECVDVIVQEPAKVEGIVRSVCANPMSAAIAVQLLRTIPELSVSDALHMESLAYAVLQGSAEHELWLSRKSPAPGSHAPGHIEVTRKGDILHVFLDRPSARNAIDQAMRDTLNEAFQLAQIDSDIRFVQLTAAGKAFCIGADISEFGTTRDPATAHIIRTKSLPAHLLSVIGYKLEVHVTGACVGSGLEMAAFANHITANANAWFQLPELAMGIIPGAGGCVSVSRRIGRHRTALMILSGKRVNAVTALEWGLIDAIIDD